MDSKSSESLIVASQDIQCPICYERYSNGKHQAMALLCGHSICSFCLPQIRSCPHCRKKITQKPAKNLLVSSFIETDSQIKKCPKHGKALSLYSNNSRKLICPDCIQEEHREEYKSIEAIQLKVNEIKKQEKQINERKGEIKQNVQESLNKRRQNLHNKVDTWLEEELATIFSQTKRLKRIIDTCNFTDKDRYEHQLLAGDLSNREQRTQEMLEKWDKNQQEEDLSARILDVPLDLKNSMDYYGDQEKKILQKIDKEEKHFENLIKAPNTLELEEIFQNSKKELTPEYATKIAKDEILRTFKDYGMRYSKKKEQNEGIIVLKENPSFNLFKKFSPKFFDCTLEKLCLACADFSDSKFRILLDILQNVQKLSVLDITLKDIGTKKAELLSNLIFNSESLRKISFSLLYGSAEGRVLEKFFQGIRASNIEINWSFSSTLIEIQRDPTKNEEPLKECKLRFSSLLVGVIWPIFSDRISLKSWKSLEKLSLSFGRWISYTDFLIERLEELKNLENLRELDLTLTDPHLSKKATLPRQISQCMLTSSHLTKFKLSLIGKEIYDDKVFLDSLFTLPKESLSANQILEELTLSFFEWEKPDLDLVSYLNHFSRLKKFTLIFSTIHKNTPWVSKLFKTLDLKFQGSIEFICKYSDHDKSFWERFRERISPSTWDVKFEQLMPHHLPDFIEEEERGFEGARGETRANLYLSDSDTNEEQDADQEQEEDVDDGEQEEEEEEEDEERYIDLEYTDGEEDEDTEEEDVYVNQHVNARARAGPGYRLIRPQTPTSSSEESDSDDDSDDTDSDAE